MESSVLISTKNNLGLPAGYAAFDHTVLTHLNAAFSVLSQLGIGPEAGFFVEDETATWDEFAADEIQKNVVKSYVYAKVRMLFDPPSTSFLITAMTEIIEQYEWRLVTMNESPGNSEEP